MLRQWCLLSIRDISTERISIDKSSLDYVVVCSVKKYPIKKLHNSSDILVHSEIFQLSFVRFSKNERIFDDNEFYMKL